MDPRTTITVAKILDSVLATVGDDEFQRLTAGLTVGERTNRVEEAARSLNEVQSLRMPDYDDELVSLFYAGRFHLSHVNLAYSMISEMSAQRAHLGAMLTESGRLHVIDFGCGTLAMRFGVILAVADALENGQDVAEIDIKSIDASTPMVNMGVKIWDAFVNQVHEQSNPKLQWIELALEKMVNQRPNVQNTTLNLIQGNPYADVWLSAIHVVYGGQYGNEDTIREGLAVLCTQTNPVVGFITCHRRNAEIARRISPFGNGFHEVKGNLRSQFTDNIYTPYITWRCQSWGFFPPSWRVFWEWDRNPATTTYLIYRRQ